MGDKPAAIAWLVKFHPEISDGQISKLIGTTKNTIKAIRERTHWNINNIPRESLHGKKKDKYFFVPKMPHVKRTPETGFNVGCFLISETSICSLLSASFKATLATENVNLLFPEPSARPPEEAMKLVVRASMRASLQDQKQKLGKSFGSLKLLDDYVLALLNGTTLPSTPAQKRGAVTM